MLAKIDMIAKKDKIDKLDKIDNWDLIPFAAPVACRGNPRPWVGFCASPRPVWPFSVPNRAHSREINVLGRQNHVFYGSGDAGFGVVLVNWTPRVVKTT